MNAVAIVDAIGRQIQRACPQRIGRPARLALFPLGQFRLAVDHLGWRRPCGPGLAVGHSGNPRPFEAGLAHRYAIADSRVVAGDQIQMPHRRVDDDRAGHLIGRVVDGLTPIRGRQLFQRNCRDGKASVLPGHIGRVIDLRRRGLGKTGLDHCRIGHAARQQRGGRCGGEKPKNGSRHALSLHGFNALGRSIVPSPA